MSISIETLAIAKKYSEDFVVSLTPTESDFSGTMDKTAAEITEAAKAGKNIIFDIDASSFGFDSWKVQATIKSIATGHDNIVCAQAFLVNIQTSPNYMIFIMTDDTSADSQIYNTRVYSLTSAF